MLRALPRFVLLVGISGLLAATGFFAPILAEAATSGTGLRPEGVIDYEWHTSKAELLSLIDRAAAADDAYYAPLESRADPTLAAAAAAEHARVSRILGQDRHDAVGLPNGPVTRKIPMQTLGHATFGAWQAASTPALAGVSEGFSGYTYYDPSGQTQAGFIVNFFASAPGTSYTAGLSSAVRADLEGSSTRSNPPWQDGGGAPLWVLICVSSVCSWQTQAADLQILDQDQTICYPSGVCVLGPPCDPTVNCARKHISLWDSNGPTSTGDAFTVGDSHHDIPGHACPDDWDGVRDYAGNSVPSSDIYVTSYTDMGTAGTITCPPGYTPAYHNGLEYNIWLKGIG